MIAENSLSQSGTIQWRHLSYLSGYLANSEQSLACQWLELAYKNSRQELLHINHEAESLPPFVFSLSTQLLALVHIQQLLMLQLPILMSLPTQLFSLMQQVSTLWVSFRQPFIGVVFKGKHFIQLILTTTAKRSCFQHLFPFLFPVTVAVSILLLIPAFPYACSLILVYTTSHFYHSIELQNASQRSTHSS